MEYSGKGLKYLFCEEESGLTGEIVTGHHLEPAEMATRNSTFTQVCFSFFSISASTDRYCLGEGPVSPWIRVFQIGTTKAQDSLDTKAMEMIGHKIKTWRPAHHS